MFDYIEQHLEELRHPLDPADPPYSEATIRDRSRCLYRLNGDSPFGWVYLCKEQLVNWLKGPVKPPWSPATKRAYTNHLIAGYGWLLARGIVKVDPTVGIRPPVVPEQPVRWASDEQLVAALGAPEPLRTAVILAAYGGFRRAEAAASFREHITKQRIVIPRAKGGRPQTLPTHEVIWDHVKERDGGPLIVDRDGVQYTAERLGGLAHRWFGAHIGPGFGLHHFRRRLGVVVQREYRDVRVTQRLLRHATLAQVHRYTDATEEQILEALRTLRRPERFIGGTDHEVPQAQAYLRAPEPGDSRLGPTPGE